MFPLYPIGFFWSGPRLPPSSSQQYTNYYTQEDRIRGLLKMNMELQEQVNKLTEANNLNVNAINDLNERLKEIEKND